MSNDFVIKVSKTTYQHCLNFSYHLVDAINKHKKICHSIKSNCVISQFLISKYIIFHLINNFIINKLSCFNGIHEIIVVPKKKSKMDFSLLSTNLRRKNGYLTHQLGKSTLCNLAMLGIALASSITSFLAINLSPSP